MCGFDQAGGQDGWILIGQVIFCLFIDQDKGKVDNNAKKKRPSLVITYMPEKITCSLFQHGKSRAGKMSLSYPVG